MMCRFTSRVQHTYLSIRQLVVALSLSFSLAFSWLVVYDGWRLEMTLLCFAFIGEIGRDWEGRIAA